MVFSRILLSAACIACACWAQFDSWTYVEVDAGRSGHWYGIDAFDVTGDGYLDIASGTYFYKNPGGDMTGNWARASFPNAADAFAMFDVDGDEFGDVLAFSCNGSYWFEANDTDGSSWTKRKDLGASTCDAHKVSTQGYKVAQIVPGGKPEVVLLKYPNTVTIVEVPENPESDSWRVTDVGGSGGFGVGVGDIDGDGDIDVCSGSKNVWWVENPGEVRAGWALHTVGSIQSGQMDRAEIGDVTGDGKPDIIVTEEASSSHLFCFEQPADPKSGNWKRTTISTGANYLSMDVGDMDNDDDLDIVTGEAVGALKIQIWENSGSGQFTAHTAAQGNKQPHIGCQLYDLDKDGDLDMVSNSWTMSNFCFVWRNDWDPPITSVREAEGARTLFAPAAYPHTGAVTIHNATGAVVGRYASTPDVRRAIRAPGLYLYRNAPAAGGYVRTMVLRK